jgi:MFS family permease
MRMNSRKTILVLSICMALQMTSFVIILPLFAHRFSELGAGVAALGFSEMAYALTSTLAAPFMGALADRFGRKPLVLLSLAAYLAAFCGYLLAQTALLVIVIRGLSGAFTAGLVPAVNGLAAEITPRERRAQWMGFINGGAAFGWIAGPIAGGLIYDHWGYHAALIVSIGMALLTLLVAFICVPKSHPSERLLTEDIPAASGSQAEKVARTKNERTQGFLPGFRSTLPKSLSAFIVLLTIFFAVLFAWALVEPCLMFYAYNDLGWSSSMLGLVMSTYGIAMMIGELSLGGLSDRLGRKPVILLGLILFSVQFIGLVLFKNYILIAITFIIGGLGNSLYDPAINASILDIAPKENSSRIMGIKSMVGSAGTILGPAIVALLSTSVDASWIFLAAVGIVFLATLSGLAYPARERQAREDYRLDLPAHP